MKPHLIVKARQPLRTRQRIPFWGDLIGDKSLAVESFSPALDREMARVGARFWVTLEHRPARPDGRWSADEQAVGFDRLYRLILQQDFELPDALVERIRLIPDLESVRVLEIGQAPLPEPAQTLDVAVSSDGSRESIGVRQARRLFGGGDSRIKVAVLDTGVNLDHPEIAERIVGRADFVELGDLDSAEFIGDKHGYDDIPEDEVGHGTHVSGIIAGAGRRMPEGVVPECALIAVRVLAAMRSGERMVGAGILDNINVGIKWAVDQGADVINMSLGVRHTGGGLPHREVIAYALAHGVSVVAASGNDGTEQKYYPGALPGVIAVGAADTRGQVAPFSSFGAPVWLLAPGTDIFSCYAQGGYALASGTSQASPFVAGAVALLKSQALAHGVRLGDAEIKTILMHTSDKPDRQMRSPRGGFGRLNLVDACRMLRYLIERRHAA